MALMNLKSDLSWYGKKPGFATKAEDIASRKTGYLYNDDLTVQTYVSGFDNNGFAKFFIPRLSSDTFAIDDASHSFRGTSSRKTQQGGGSKFPIGPKGQIHDFDIPRLGFHIDNRYGNTYNAKSLSGLAATYTKNSPIDDVYNIVKVRDVSYDPFGYASPPYILRGIQRDDNRYPQRWGTGNQIADTVSLALGVPRGGALAFGERAANDVARLAKMLIRPMGLGWIAKQALLHLMNPNTEDEAGFIAVRNNHKVSSPLNTLLAAGVSGLGIHPRKHGLLPIGGGGRYEDIISNRNFLSRGVAWNRLNRLLKEQTFDYAIGNAGYLLSVISGPGGPNSIGGIGFTGFTKSQATIPTTPERLLAMPGKDGKGITNYNSIPGSPAPLQSINSLTPKAIARDQIIAYGKEPFTAITEPRLDYQRSPLRVATEYGILGRYSAGGYLRELTAFKSVDKKVTIYSAGTRPDVSVTWQIEIPKSVNIRSGKAPITKDTFTLEALLGNSRYFRSYLNPYSSIKGGVGYRNLENKSALEYRYDDQFTTISGIPDNELNSNPNSSDASNEFSMRSIYYPQNVNIASTPILNGPLLNTLQRFYNKTGTVDGNDLRRLYRDYTTRYGKNDSLGYSSFNKATDNTPNTVTPGAMNIGDSPLTSKQEKLAADGLNPGDASTIGVRLVDPKAAGRTAGADTDSIALTGLQAYKTMTYPAIMKAAKARNLSAKSTDEPTTFDFTTGLDWTALNSPMAKIGGIGGGDQHRKDTWDSATTANHPIYISIGGRLFPAYITDISTKTDQSLLTFKPAGSPVAVLAGAQNFSTGFSITFIVAASSEAEYTTHWSNLKDIQGFIKPSAAAGVWSPLQLNVRVGSLINESAYLTSLSLSLDNEYPWDIGDEKPMYINVDCQFEVIDGSGVYG